MSKTDVEEAKIARDFSDENLVLKNRWYSWIFRMRIEEFTALVFFFPMLYLTVKAYMFFKAQGDIPNVFMGDLQRVFGIIIAVIISFLIMKYRPSWTFLRDSLPFAYCIAIYTNLHDTIHFANPNDIHHYLIAIDQWMFGVQPCVWAEQFIHPVLTEIFSFCYMIFFSFAPAVALTLYLQKRRIEFRAVMVSVILCFYTGYILYVLFPAVPPRITLQHLFTINFNGTPLADTAIAMINVLPRESRAAFPFARQPGAVLRSLGPFVDVAGSRCAHNPLRCHEHQGFRAHLGSLHPSLKPSGHWRPSWKASRAVLRDRTSRSPGGVQCGSVSEDQHTWVWRWRRGFP